MEKVLIIDDEDSFLDLVRDHIGVHFPGLAVLTCDDPVHCLASITTDLDLLLIDLEMPGMDGAKVLAYAVSKGIARNRIIIFSGRDADYLHKQFPMGSRLRGAPVPRRDNYSSHPDSQEQGKGPDS